MYLQLCHALEYTASNIPWGEDKHDTSAHAVVFPLYFVQPFALYAIYRKNIPVTEGIRILIVLIGILGRRQVSAARRRVTRLARGERKMEEVRRKGTKKSAWQKRWHIYSARWWDREEKRT